jgi:hypothetical protein
LRYCSPDTPRFKEYKPGTRRTLFCTFNSVELTKPNIRHTITQEKGTTTITLQTDMVAKGIHLQFLKTPGKFSDNYFDLLPGEKSKWCLTEHRVMRIWLFSRILILGDRRVC